MLGKGSLVITFHFVVSLGQMGTMIPFYEKEIVWARPYYEEKVRTKRDYAKSCL